MARDYIIVDLDNTLCASWRRESLIDEEGWDAFHEDCINDEPIVEVINLINSLSNSFTVIALTGRNKKYWPATLSWLVKHKVNLNEVIMRADDDYRPTAEVKVAMATTLFGGEENIKDNVMVVIDDDEKVIQAFAALGVTTFHCQPRRN